MEIKGTTKLTGVFGYPVSHSLSPVFQNAAFEFLGLDYIYIPLEVKPENLKIAVEAIKVFNFAGVNVTIPHKKNIVCLMDEIDDEVEILGVVNTVHNKNGKLKGYITDGKGFVKSLKEEGNFIIKDKIVFVLGAGGSAYAICGALIREKVGKIYITNRTYEKAIRLKKHLEEKLSFRDVEVIPFEERNKESYWKNVDLIINTTSVGMKEGDGSLIEEKNLSSVSFIYDIVYNRKTELIKLAEKLEIPHLDGLSMLVYQGAISFEIWTGRKAPMDVMKNKLYQFIKNHGI